LLRAVAHARGGVEQLQRRPEEVPHLLRPVGYQRKEHVEMTTTTLWRYDDPAWAEIDLVGYDVEAVDGEIGETTRRSRKSAPATSSSTPGHGSSARR
jgi:hypothetical protein